MYNSRERDPSVVIVGIALIIGAIAFLVIYGMKSGQNHEAANTVVSNMADAIDSTNLTVSQQEYATFAQEAYANGQVIFMTEAHAGRHSKTVKDISSKCNENNFTVKMHDPTTGRDAFICFVEEFWVITVKQFDPAKIEEFGDDVVTAFPRRAAKTVEEVIGYLTKRGYVQ